MSLEALDTAEPKTRDALAIGNVWLFLFRVLAYVIVRSMEKNKIKQVLRLIYYCDAASTYTTTARGLFLLLLLRCCLLD